jgi:hypothetical protein
MLENVDDGSSVLSVREMKCTRLGYRTRLSRLHTLDPPISLGFSEEPPSSNIEPEQENNQETQNKSHVLQTDPRTTGLHNSNQRREKEKAIDHMRVKTYKNRHKTEAQFYEHNYIPDEAK